MDRSLLRKRYIFAAALFFGAASLVVAATCPLSISYTTTSSTSPEKTQQCYYVSHNSKKVCVPAAAVASHRSYGDTGGYGSPCTCPAPPGK